MATSALAWQWVVEALAGVQEASTSVLGDLVNRVPDVLSGSSVHVRERLALRYLEECSGMVTEETPPPLDANVPSTSASVAVIDAAQTCEEVLRQKAEKSNDIGSGNMELPVDNLHQFILLKRATLLKPSVELLKDKILGSSPHLQNSKECNGPPSGLGPFHMNNISYESRRDHRSLKKIISMKHANSWANKLTLTRRYRKLILDREASNKQQMAEKNFTCGDKKNKQTEIENKCNGIQVLMNQEIRKMPFVKLSSSHDGDEIQHLRENSATLAAAPDSALEKLNGSLQPQVQVQGALHDGRADLHKEVGSGCDNGQLLKHDSMPQPYSERNICFKCGKSGQLLNCNSDDCSTTIHESCLGQLANFETKGSFYCPFCNYKNALVSYRKEKRKAQQARRNMFSFYDISPLVKFPKEKRSKCMDRSGQVGIHHTLNEHRDLLLRRSELRGGNSQHAENNQSSSMVDDHQISQNLQNQQSQQNDISDVVCKNLSPRKGKTKCHDQHGVKRKVKDDCHQPTKGNLASENQLDGAADLLHQNMSTCGEALARHPKHDVRDAPVKSQSDIGRDDECSIRESEGLQPVENIIRTSNGVLPCDRDTTCKTTDVCGGRDNRKLCTDQLNLELKYNVYADAADQNTCSIRANKRSSLQVKGEGDYSGKRMALASRISGSYALRSRSVTAGKSDNHKRAVQDQKTATSPLRKRKKQCSIPKEPYGRRTKLIWKPEEEQLLEEALLKFPKNSDGRIQWTNILVYGRQVFHETRTPIDLKDKWRNMQRKRPKT
ncbi:hypothetical protein AXF42_Ash002578 [Apostasia shenzhenica]|uniref:Myb-like domain-containing protein n=1 Tax=Apostasia shenzhenica TaxID=1088818 RepID=A0A2I0AP18_9ASPA|nr:hypothetical protein AXF42_Ash002578 [Apostasia shenzhenica]